MAIKALLKDGLSTLCDNIKGVRHTAEDANNLAGLAGAGVLELKDEVDQMNNFTVVGSGYISFLLLEYDDLNIYMKYDTSSLEGDYVLQPVFSLPADIFTISNGDKQSLWKTLSGYLANDEENSRFVLHLYNASGNTMNSSARTSYMILAYKCP